MTIYSSIFAKVRIFRKLNYEFWTVWMNILVCLYNTNLLQIHYPTVQYSGKHLLQLKG